MSNINTGIDIFKIDFPSHLNDRQFYILFKEGVNFARRNYKIDNLCLIVDNNNLQIDGKVEDVMNIYPIKEKFQSFGFKTFEVDGHNIDELINVFQKAKTVKEKPTVIIAKTVKGKGVSYMEGEVVWHGKAPNKEQYEIALEELSKND